MAETWTYIDASTIEIAGDVTARYWPNLIVAITQTTQKFFVISAVALVSGNTRLTLDGCGIYTVADATITTHAVTANDAIQGLPYGFGSIRPSQQGFIGLFAADPESAIDIGHPPNGVTNRYIRIGNYLRVGSFYYSAGCYVANNARLTKSSESDGNKFVPIWSPGAAVIQLGGFSGIIDFFGINWNSSSDEKSFPNDFTHIMSIDYRGMVGIGKTPEYPLDVVGTVAADAFYDRTPGFSGDALKAIRSIKSHESGQIDHDSLPDFVRVVHEVPVFEDREVERDVPVLDKNGMPMTKDNKFVTEKKKVIEKVQIGTKVQQERNIGNMVSILTKGVQELLVVIEDRDAKIEALTARLKKLEDGLKMGARI